MDWLWIAIILILPVGYFLIRIGSIAYFRSKLEYIRRLDHGFSASDKTKKQ